jgi:regulatory protein
MQQPSLRVRAMQLLARREHSRRELGSKLAKHAETPEEIETVLDELAKRGMLSDARFAEMRTHILSKKYGASRIAQDLRARGVSDELADKAVDSARASEVERARIAWGKRFRSPPANALEKAKQMRFLQGRGFSFETIRAVVPAKFTTAVDDDGADDAAAE